MGSQRVGQDQATEQAEKWLDQEEDGAKAKGKGWAYSIQIKRRPVWLEVQFSYQIDAEPTNHFTGSIRKPAHVTEDASPPDPPVGLQAPPVYPKKYRNKEIVHVSVNILNNHRIQTSLVIQWLRICLSVFSPSSYLMFSWICSLLSSHRTCRIKWFLARKQKRNHPIP